MITVIELITVVYVLNVNTQLIIRLSICQSMWKHRPRHHLNGTNWVTTTSELTTTNRVTTTNVVHHLRPPPSIDRYVIRAIPPNTRSGMFGITNSLRYVCLCNQPWVLHWVKSWVVDWLDVGVVFVSTLVLGCFVTNMFHIPSHVLSWPVA